MHTGAMIALIPCEDDLKRLEVLTGESRDELHTTLLFLGEGEQIPEEARQRILEAALDLVDDMPVVTAEAFALSVFNPPGVSRADGMDRDPCIVLGIGDPNGELTTLRGAIEEIFNGEPLGFELPQQHSPWTPHVTLQYLGSDEPLPNIADYADRVGPIVFDQLRITFAGETYDIPLDLPTDVDVDDNGEIVVPNVLLDLQEYTEAFQREGNVRAPGVGHNLRNYWIRGKGAAKIRWGTEGSMKRCIRNLRKYVRDPGGLCATYHHVATGEWPRGGTVPSEVDIITAGAGADATHAGVALVAADTGRILMLQRSINDPEDPAAGTWEFPGGSIEPGESALQAAAREWSEEIGQPLPSHDVLDVWHSSNGGTYRGFIIVTNSESDVTMTDGRLVVNPDDPDGDNSEQAAWWDVEDAERSTALREELQVGAGNHSPWHKLRDISNAVVMQ